MTLIFGRLVESSIFKNEVLCYAGNLGFLDLVNFLKEPEIDLKQSFNQHKSEYGYITRHKRILRIIKKTKYKRPIQLKNKIWYEIYHK